LVAQEKEQWQQIAEELGTYYLEEKDALRRAIDKIFRKAMVERANLTLQECRNVKGKRILDIACSTGSMSIQLAKKGAFVIGVDPSKDAVDKANAKAKEEDLNQTCVFIKDDFAKHVFNQKFDISIALGFFDFTVDPELNIRRMKAVTTEKCLMSFPAKFAFQVPLRLIWSRSRNLPVRFYTKKELKRLFSPSFSHFKIKNISAGYYCVVTV
jgi:2-polyprenyl-3-methyl-5-hydroxy-6-metoxy-1,4-benzoquinol methylase